MTNNEMADLIAEILAVDAEEGFAKNIIVKDSSIQFSTKDDEVFIINVSK